MAVDPGNETIDIVVKIGVRPNDDLLKIWERRERLGKPFLGWERCPANGDGNDRYPSGEHGLQFDAKMISRIGKPLSAVRVRCVHPPRPDHRKADLAPL